MTHPVDVAVIGAGQAGLATAYYLRRAGLEPGTGYVVLDANPAPGGAWQHLWPSLRLFSPAEYSSLPGWLMPTPSGAGFPPAEHVVDYLTRYEERYELPVHHGTRVLEVCRADTEPRGPLVLRTADGAWAARAVVSATGTWGRPFVPHYPGVERFRGHQLHSAAYRGPQGFAGRRVVVVGGGNTGAQLLAELSEVATTTWVTLRPPRFLPDDVDGRALFAVATARRRALDAGDADPGGVASLGDVVMVPPVRAARDRGALVALPMFERLTEGGVAWADGTEQPADVVLWCTGFRPDLGHLAPLGLRGPDGRIEVAGARALAEPRLHLLGYGDWTGPGSATLIGVGRTAREAVAEITAALR
ncbi:ArsO family NAD(P)H-dependent flavin-containing monooxygenase [Knoellia sp. 3-2P3]|uniref:ArsO family NAD(P)H-dependent flavin-containing monooxygenase n=1 Tax=unclassified Knoellia TaxID=2618719 RepID=UPI0023DC74DD|nr:ArsO family NAD(P)H-dependent flavin-containing monooxygenase [Knoellia sp. 3-2P3]MDF2094229.1 ArsO family NAD(P)H-dependent flavin-containing monooxygenase [Knoellia sp. 3-2P3]